MSKEIEVLYITEDDIESCGLWQEDTGTPFIRKSDYDELAKDMSAQATALYDLLTAKLAEAERQLEELRGLRKQEPVAWIHPLYKESGFKLVGITRWSDDCLPLYAAPIPTVTPTTAVKEVWLCYAYGETEWPCVVIASNREQIRQFVIDEWLGDSDDEQLPEIMERIDAYDWKDGTLEWRFEIGGVKISKVYNAAPIPPDNHDWKAEYLRQVDLHNQTLDELREAEMQLRNPAPTPPTPSQQEALNDLRELDTNFEFEGRMAVLRFKRE